MATSSIDYLRSTSEETTWVMINFVVVKAHNLLTGHRSNIYEYLMRLSIWSRINSKVSRRVGEEVVVWDAAIMPGVVTEEEVAPEVGEAEAGEEADDTLRNNNQGEAHKGLPGLVRCLKSDACLTKLGASYGTSALECPTKVYSTRASRHRKWKRRNKGALEVNLVEQMDAFNS